MRSTPFVAITWTDSTVTSEWFGNTYWRDTFHVYPSAIGSAIARGSHRVKVWVMVKVGAATEYILRVTVLLYQMVWLTDLTAICHNYENDNPLDSGYWTAGQRLDGDDTPFVWRVQADSCQCEITSVISFSDWTPGEPNNYRNTEEACMHMCSGVNYRWNDIECDLKSCSICEIDLWPDNQLSDYNIIHCVQKKQPLLFSCITLGKSNQFEWKFKV